MTHMRLRVEIRASRHTVGSGRKLRKIDAARIDDGEFQQSPFGQRFKVCKPRRCILGQRPHTNAGRGNGGIYRNIDLGAYALDDLRVDLPVKSLRSAPVVGVYMQDACTSSRTSDPLSNDGLHGVGNTRLPRAAPRPVQGCLDPGLVHPTIISQRGRRPQLSPNAALAHSVALDSRAPSQHSARTSTPRNTPCTSPESMRSPLTYR